MKILDYLEEWIIAFLMGAATLLIFVAVVHRYAAGLPDPWRAGRLAQDRPLVGAGALHLHVRVDGQVRRRVRRAHRHPRRRRRDDQSAAGQHAQALRPVRPARGRHVHGDRRHAGRDASYGTSGTPIRCRPTSKCRSGSSTCAFRSARTSCASASCRWRGRSARTGELPHHDVAHVEGIDEAGAYALDDNLHPAPVHEGKP